MNLNHLADTLSSMPSIVVWAILYAVFVWAVFRMTKSRELRSGDAVSAMSFHHLDFLRNRIAVALVMPLLACLVGFWFFNIPQDFLEISMGFPGTKLSILALVLGICACTLASFRQRRFGIIISLLSIIGILATLRVVVMTLWWGASVFWIWAPIIGAVGFALILVYGRKLFRGMDY